MVHGVNGQAVVVEWDAAKEQKQDNGRVLMVLRELLLTVQV